MIAVAIPAMGRDGSRGGNEDPACYDAEPIRRNGHLNWKFHATLYAACNRPHLLAMIEANYGHVSRFTRALVSQATGKERPQREHYRLLELCRDGEIKKAVGCW